MFGPVTDMLRKGSKMQAVLANKANISYNGARLQESLVSMECPRSLRRSKTEIAPTHPQQAMNSQKRKQSPRLSMG